MAGLRHWKERAAMRTGTANGRGVRDYAPIRCMLEMTDDSVITVIVKPGCSVADVHDMLTEITPCKGRFEHITIVDEDEANE